MTTAESTISSQGTRLTTAEGQISTTNTNVTTLQTKTQYQTAGSNTTTFASDVYLSGTGRSVWIGGNTDASAQKLRLHQSGTSSFVDVTGDGNLQFRFQTAPVTKATLSAAGELSLSILSASNGMKGFTTLPTQNSSYIGYTRFFMFNNSNDTVLTSGELYNLNSSNGDGYIELSVGVWQLDAVLMVRGNNTGNLFEVRVGFTTSSPNWQYSASASGARWTSVNYGGSVISTADYQSYSTKHSQILQVASAITTGMCQFEVYFNGNAAVKGARSFVQITRIA